MNQISQLNACIYAIDPLGIIYPIQVILFDRDKGQIAFATDVPEVFTIESWWRMHPVCSYLIGCKIIKTNCKRLYFTYEHEVIEKREI